MKTKRLRVRFLSLSLSGALLAIGVWWAWAAASLVHSDAVQPADAIVIENFEPKPLLFQQAATLVQDGLAHRVIVPVEGGGGIEEGMVELMARAAHLKTVETITVRPDEPVTLNAVIDIKAYLVSQKIRSVLVVSDGFRSRRTYLIYHHLLRPAGIMFSIIPVFGRTDVGNWRKSWHGIQDVTLEFGKLWYYQIFVLPFR